MGRETENKREILGPHPSGSHFFLGSAPTLVAPPFGARFFLGPTHWAMTHTPDPEMDWPKTGLAQIGQAKTTMAKNGLAKIGHIRMAKT